MKTIAVLLASFLCFAGTALADSVCGEGDYARVVTRLLSDGAARSNEELKISPEDFLKIDPEAARMLSANLLICPDIRLSETGKLPVDFPALLEQVEICYGSRDWDCIKRLKQSFVAKPLPVSEAHTLLPIVRGNFKEWIKPFGKVIRVSPTEGYLFNADIFYAFGGKLLKDDGKPVNFDINAFLVPSYRIGSMFDEIKDIYEKHRKKTVYLFADCYMCDALAQSFQRLRLSTKNPTWRHSRVCLGDGAKLNAIIDDIAKSE